MTDLEAAVVHWAKMRARFMVGSKWAAKDDMSDLRCFRDATEALTKLAETIEGYADA